MIEGRHYQNAYVTRDIQKAIDTFKVRADVRKLIQYEGSTWMNDERWRQVGGR